jgi:ribosomal protein S18 acetylase RimI-like enzyme
VNTLLVRATAQDIEDYIRIAMLNVSRLNIIATDPVEVAHEIEVSVVYMIRVAGRSIGFVSYVMRSPNQAYISEVQVEPDFRGQGIGGYALSFILEELKNIDVVYLWTHPENPAQKLYRRNGFHENGEVIHNDGGTGEPRMKMVLVRS